MALVVRCEKGLHLHPGCVALDDLDLLRACYLQSVAVLAP